MPANDSLTKAISALHAIVLDTHDSDEERALRQAMDSLELARKLLTQVSRARASARQAVRGAEINESTR